MVPYGLFLSDSEKTACMRSFLGFFTIFLIANNLASDEEEVIFYNKFDLLYHNKYS